VDLLCEKRRGDIFALIVRSKDNMLFGAPGAMHEALDVWPLEDTSSVPPWGESRYTLSLEVDAAQLSDPFCSS